MLQMIWQLHFVESCSHLMLGYTVHTVANNLIVLCTHITLFFPFFTAVIHSLLLLYQHTHALTHVEGSMHGIQSIS